MQKCLQWFTAIKRPAAAELSFFTPLGAYVEENLEIQAWHGTSQHRKILLVKQVFDRDLHGKISPGYGEKFFDRHVAHKIRRYISRDRVVVARHGEAFAIPTPFVEQPPAFPCQPRRYRRRELRYIDQLFADGLVALAHRLALVDRGRPRKIAVGTDLPVTVPGSVEARLQFHSVGMYFFEVLRRPEILLASQGYPQNPVVDVGIEPRRLAVNRVPTLFGEGKRYAAVVGEAVFGLQVGIAARLEVRSLSVGKR